MQYFMYIVRYYIYNISGGARSRSIVVDRKLSADAFYEHLMAQFPEIGKLEMLYCTAGKNKILQWLPVFVIPKELKERDLHKRSALYLKPLYENVSEVGVHFEI